MAMEKVLGGGNFGKVAGSLLSQKSSNFKDAIKLSLFEEIFNNLKIDQKQKLIKTSAELKDNFDINTLSRKQEYDLEENNRTQFRKYLSNKEGAIEEKAKELYNTDSNIEKFGINYTNRGSLTGDKKIIDEQIWQNKKKQALNFFENLEKNPLVSTPTFIKYNQVYLDEFKAALAQVQDDPTKKSLLFKAADKIFPQLFDGKQAELELAFEKEKSDREAQETKQSAFNPNYRNQVQFETVESAIEHANTIYSGQINDETLIKINEQITNSKRKGFNITENDILGIAISTQVLGDNNLTQVQKEIQNATETFNMGYVQKFGSIPERGTNEFTIYEDSKTDYLDINVYKLDPLTSKVNMLERSLKSLSKDSPQYKIIKQQLSELGKNTIIDRVILNNLNAFSDPLRLAEINQAISNEKNKANPAFTDINSWFAHTISTQKSAYDNLNL